MLLDIEREREKEKKWEGGRGILTFRKHWIHLGKVLFQKVSSKISQMEF